MNKVKVIVAALLSTLLIACGSSEPERVAYVVTPDSARGPVAYVDKGIGEYTDITKNLSKPASKLQKHSDAAETSTEYDSICQVGQNTLSRFPKFGVDEEIKCHSFEEILDKGIGHTDGKVIQYTCQGKVITKDFVKSHEYQCSDYSLYCYGSDKDTGTQYVIRGQDTSYCSSSLYASMYPISYMDVGGDFRLEGGITRNSSTNDVAALYGPGLLDTTDDTLLLTYYVEGGGSLCFTWDKALSKLVCAHYVAP